MCVCVCVSVCLSVRPSVRPSVRLSVCLSVCLPGCLVLACTSCEEGEATWTRPLCSFFECPDPEVHSPNYTQAGFFGAAHRNLATTSSPLELLSLSRSSPGSRISRGLALFGGHERHRCKVETSAWAKSLGSLQGHYSRKLLAPQALRKCAFRTASR